MRPTHSHLPETVMKSFRMAALTAAALFLAACDAIPTEPSAARLETTASAGAAEHYTATYTLPLDGVEFVLYCEGTPSEWVTLSGEREGIFDFVSLPDGSFHSRYASRALNLEAVGNQTGARYRASFSGHSVSFLSDGLTVNYRERMQLRNMDEAYAFDVVISGMARLDENYQVIVTREDIRANCPMEE
jgi:hypothetical protein